MKDLVRRCTESLARAVMLVRPVRLVRPVSVAVRPYSCVYVAGPALARWATGGAV